jgi:hypothetical protein
MSTRAFHFVLSHFIKYGINELGDYKLGVLIILKYDILADSKKTLRGIPIFKIPLLSFKSICMEGEEWCEILDGEYLKGITPKHRMK